MAGPDLRSSDAIARAVDEAAGHYRQGRLDDADRLCARILKASPDWFDALHVAGLVKLEAGKAAAAQVLLVNCGNFEPMVGGSPVFQKFYHLFNLFWRCRVIIFGRPASQFESAEYIQPVGGRQSGETKKRSGSKPGAFWCKTGHPG
jgi:hypothetical protein